ncbi:Hemolysin-type calcium-binding region [Synechococcus sp. WH 8109]|uniref:beta strand repeat-containing protein n=1 Tax=Synechococcus sp. WH 8109 TaxID=166314 RepID=UPI0002DC833C|nr:hypothetical protein [Synechococcus sp. WH 8109]AHF62522.1 Hemolysin-type calcium-binding region [Synechococcus sp. WH 8109]
MTIGTEAAEAGIDTVTFTDTAKTDSLVVEAGFTNNLTVNLDTDNTQDNSIVATNYTKVLTVNALDTDIDDNVTTITGGTGTADVLKITASGDTIAAAQLASVTKVEKFEILTNNAINLTIHDNNAVGTGAAGDETITVDASALTTANATISAAAEDDSKVVITTGGGADTITGSASANHGDTITAGDGNDVLKFTNAGLTAADSVAGGIGTDTIEYTDAADVVDADFTLVTGVETITTTAGIRLTNLVLGEKALAAGINTVTFADTDAVDKVTVGAAFTRDLEVDLRADTGAGQSIIATNYTGSLTVDLTDSFIDNDGAAGLTTITGGTGTDTMNVTASGSAIAAADMAQITKVENIVVDSGLTSAFGLTLSDNNAVGTGAAGDETITVNASALTTGVATIDASAEDDAKVVINTGGANDFITASTSANNGDTITAGAGDDIIYFGNGDLTAADSVGGGAGANTIQFTEDSTVADAAFTLVTNVQTLQTTDDKMFTALTLGAAAMAAGVTTVNLRGTAGGDADVVTVGAGFTSALTVDFDADDAVANKVDATNYTGALTITAADSDLDDENAAGVATITGGSGSDTIAITVGGNAIAAADLASVTKVETIQIVGTTANADITLNNNNATYTHEALFETITIDGSSLTTGVLTLDASAEVDGKVVIIGGADNDVITADASANVGSNITAGAGTDTIHISADGVLTNIDTIAGGDGADTMSFSANSTVTDAHFANVSSIETLTGANNIEFTSLTLGSNAQTTNVSTVTFAGNTASSLTVSNGFTNTLTVNSTTTAGQSDNIDGSAAAAAIQVVSAAANIAAGDTIKGGTGTSDKLTITADDGTATTTLMTGVENITVAYAANKDVSITMGANNTQIASGSTLTVDASAMTETDEILTFTGNAAETDGLLNITGSSGADVITDAGAADTISGGAGADTITAAAGADSIVGGAGADSITGGAGADTLTGGTEADIFVYTAVAQSNSSATDTITDFTSGADKLNITLDYSGLGAGSHATVNATVVTAAAGITAVQAALSAERGQYIHDTTNNKLYVNVNDDNLITTLDYQIATTTAAADGDINFTISGGAGNDTITAGGGADTITGGAGTDSITAGDGADTIIRNGDGTTDGYDIVTFVVADDIIDFTTNGAKVNGTAVTAYNEGALGAMGATHAFTAFSDNITVANSLTGPTEAEIETYLGATAVFQNGATGDAQYVAADNGTDTFIFYIEEGADGTNKQFDAADDIGYAMMRLVGVDDATSLSAANFADFT